MTQNILNFIKDTSNCKPFLLMRKFKITYAYAHNLIESLGNEKCSSLQEAQELSPHTHIE